MVRRGHRKSRLGCAECKQRHKKCDETRPLCVNCKIADVRCSYLDDHGVVGSDSVGSSHVSSSSVRSSTDTNTGTGTGTGTPTERSFVVNSSSPAGSNNLQSLPLPLPQLQQRQQGDTNSVHVNMNHLELLYNYQFESYKWFTTNEALSMQYTAAAVRQGLTHPFLMYEVLALSSLHLAIYRPERATFYRQQAHELQVLAVQGFQDVALNINQDNCVAVFIFSSAVGLHSFCDTLTFRDGDDFGHVLDKLTDSITLLRGIRIVMDGWWEFLRTSEVSEMLTAGALPEVGAPKYTECRPLVDLVASSADLSPRSRAVYENAIQRLQRIFDVENSETQRVVNYVFAWVVTTENEYAGLLRQRQPEALIILAYYAVLLHRRRRIWAIQDAGSYLIQTIASYLGSHWSRWIEWPLKVLQDEAVT